MGVGAESFSTGASFTAATAYGIVLPWRATEVTIVNDGAKELHIALGSTVPTTDDWYLKAGESHTWHMLLDRLSMITTATSCARIGAWRY